MDKHHAAVDRRRVQRAVGETPIADMLLTPVALQGLMLVSLGLGIFLPVLLFPLIIFNAGALIAFSDRPFRMPLRLPKDVPLIDLTTATERPREHRGAFGLFRFVTRRTEYRRGAGILCLGYARGRHLGRELWLTLEDALKHLQMMATTGSGKTEAILSIELNALCWGRGMVLCDGKSEAVTAFAVWSLARRFAREDDVLVLNFLTGGDSRMQKLVDGDNTRAQSNSINLFSTASETFIIQLMDSLLPAASSGEDGWQDKARAMIAALIYALRYKSARDGILLSQSVIQHYLPLRNLVGLYQEALKNNWHEGGYRPIENYLSTLAGFDMQLINRPSEWTQDVFNQHGFLIQQFTRMLSLFNDIYGHVFPRGAGDVDLRDVLHNNRILVVLIPSLELSSGEAATLGKLIISGLRMTISQDLGKKLEGKRRDVLIAKRYASPFPFPIIFDELGAYFAPGLDKLAQQMRSLQFMLMIAAQDVQSLLAKSVREFLTLSGNQSTKWYMALEDAKDTFDVINSAAGKDYYSELATVERKSGVAGDQYEDASTAQIRERDRITLRELKALNPGEGVIVFKDACVRSASLYIADDDKLSTALPMRINRFLEIRRPTFDDLCVHIPDLARRRPLSQANVEGILRRFDSLPPRPESVDIAPGITDATLMKLSTLSLDLNIRSDVSYTPAERGILLFETARQSLQNNKGKYHLNHAPPENKVSRLVLDQQTALQQPENTQPKDTPHDPI